METLDYLKNFYENYDEDSRFRSKHGMVEYLTTMRYIEKYISQNSRIIEIGAATGRYSHALAQKGHTFLHIRNYESIGYWDFWQKQSLIPGQDCETICGLLDSIKGKLDDQGGSESNSGSGHVIGYLNDPKGRLCSWDIPLAECYGVRLPLDYQGEVPAQMLMMEVPEAEYIVFEHGPFSYEQQNCSVEQKVEEAMNTFDYEKSGYCLDTTPGRMGYLYHDPDRFWKLVRPVRKL